MPPLPPVARFDVKVTCSNTALPLEMYTAPPRPAPPAAPRPPAVPADPFRPAPPDVPATPVEPVTPLPPGAPATPAVPVAPAAPFAPVATPNRSVTPRTVSRPPVTVNSRRRLSPLRRDHVAVAVDLEDLPGADDGRRGGDQVRAVDREADGTPRGHGSRKVRRRAGSERGVGSRGRGSAQRDGERQRGGGRGLREQWSSDTSGIDDATLGLRRPRAHRAAAHADP